MSILIAFSKLKGINTLLDGKSKNAGTSMNKQGDSFETFIQNLFDKNKISFIGNSKNPPDIMLKGGEAIEVKKMEKEGSGINLNSSFPKAKLFSNDGMITRKCTECEEWKEKDFVYVIGVVEKNKEVKSVWFVYGDCYAADNKVYQKIKDRVSTKIKNTSNTEWSNTKEIGRINNVDPLGITYLRVRGMWGIQNPQNVFSDFVDKENNAYMIMRKEKYNSFPPNEIKKLKAFTTQDIEINDPNNPAKKIKAVLIKTKI